MSDTKRKAEQLYNEAFYAERHTKTAHAAREVLERVWSAVSPLDSAVDVGCGVGTWLSTFRELGGSEVSGIDGPWVNVKSLVILESEFTQVDLTTAFAIPKRYDLAISVEVAEHLSASRADSFVDSLCALSDTVVFSAAIPGQGGVDHQNEQWQSYWASHFARNGYVPHDIVRPFIWTDQEIPVWYRQNILVYRRVSDAVAPPHPTLSVQGTPLDLVHPQLFTSQTGLSVGAELSRLGTALRKYAKRRLGKSQ